VREAELATQLGVADVVAAFGLDLDRAPTLVRRSINEIWRAHRSGREVYLRITPAHHRGVGDVAAELSWMEALAAAELRVVRPLRSEGGELLVGSGPVAACFTAAPGRAARKPDDYRAPVLISWAGLMADLHRHARLAPAQRPLWHEDRVYRVARAAHDEATKPAQVLLGELASWLDGLPTSSDGFGLTHADLHLGNLAVDEAGAVTAFDFDDSCQHWFVHDVAVAVTSIRKAAWEYPGHFDAGVAEAQFLAAYAAAGGVTAWLPRLEAFVAYRIALSACWASASLALGELDEELTAWFARSLPWWLGSLEARRGQIAAAMGT
jgi:Ser/Thr protein kinase RdoA (MazF antagonist)